MPANKSADPKWTQDDLKEFDRCISLCDSIRQMDRINGRLDLHKLQGRLGKETLNEMWPLIKDGYHPEGDPEKDGA